MACIEQCIATSYCVASVVSSFCINSEKALASVLLLSHAAAYYVKGCEGFLVDGLWFAAERKTTSANIRQVTINKVQVGDIFQASRVQSLRGSGAPRHNGGADFRLSIPLNSHWGQYGRQELPPEVFYRWKIRRGEDLRIVSLFSVRVRLFTERIAPREQFASFESFLITIHVSRADLKCGAVIVLVVASPKGPCEAIQPRQSL